MCTHIWTYIYIYVHVYLCIYIIYMCIFVYTICVYLFFVYRSPFSSQFALLPYSAAMSQNSRKRCAEEEATVKCDECEATIMRHRGVHHGGWCCYCSAKVCSKCIDTQHWLCTTCQVWHLSANFWHSCTITDNWATHASCTGGCTGGLDLINLTGIQWCKKCAHAFAHGS